MKAQTILKNMLKRLCMATIFCVFLGAGNAYAAVDATINVDNVNVRSASSTSSDVVMKLNSKQAVIVFGDEGDFYKLSVKDKQNVFIAKQFVTIGQPYGVVNDMNVNIRKSASTAAEVVGKANNGEYYAATAVEGDWYAISYNGTSAYIHKDFFKGDALAKLKKAEEPKDTQAPVAPAQAEQSVIIENAQTPYGAPEPVVVTTVADASPSAATDTAENGIYAVITADTGLNLRTAASTSADALSVIPYGEVLNVTALSDQWVAVSFNGQDGFVNAEFVTVSSGPKPEKLVKPPSEITKGKEIIAYAEQFLGTPYRYGGTDLRNGVDCSGFVYAVMRNFGIHLNRSSASMTANGEAISKDELRAGDLVFFSAGGATVTHVALYIGDGKYIHSTDAKNKGVSYSSLYDDYSARTYHSARRVIK